MIIQDIRALEILGIDARLIVRRDVRPERVIVLHVRKDDDNGITTRDRRRERDLWRAVTLPCLSLSDGRHL